MNKKILASSLLFFVFICALLAKLLIEYVPSGINCTGTLAMNNPEKNDYLFSGTITVKLFTDGEGSISIYGNSFSRLRPEDSMKHLVFRDIFFKFTKPHNDNLLVSDIKMVRHPLDNIQKDEADGLLFDIFDFEGHRLTVRRVSNGYVFGDQPVPSFICVMKTD
jgi:hypothetical protein